MSDGRDDTKATAKEPGSPDRKSMALWAVAFAAVLVVGIVIGFTLGRGAEAPAEDTAAEATDTPTATPEPGGAPTTPIPEGSALATVTTPPESTLAMIDASKLSPDAEYTVTFMPYGYGPPQGGQTLVVRIEESTPENESAKAYDFTGRNLLASVEPGSDPVTLGGTYTATLAFQSQGNLLTPVLSDIAAE